MIQMVCWYRRYYPNNCFYCGIGMNAEKHHICGRTIDHVEPRSLGGKSCKTNKVPACRGCNQAKGSLTLEEFRAVELMGVALDFNGLFYGEAKFYNDEYP